jgi:hypothetical protein
VITIRDIERALEAAPPTRQWTNPAKAAWYAWRLPHAGQGPHLTLRLVCPLKACNDERLLRGRAFELVLIASAGCKTERVLCRLFEIQPLFGWEESIGKRLQQAIAIMSKAPRCPNCQAAMYPERVKSTSRLFWCCARFPNC